jgi:hypothetical protein
LPPARRVRLEYLQWISPFGRRLMKPIFLNSKVTVMRGYSSAGARSV